MLSVAILAAEGEMSSLARSLTDLVPGAVEALVRDVMIAPLAGAGNPIDHKALAEASGASLLPAQSSAATALHRALADARQPWLLWLVAGDRLAPGWIGALGAHVDNPGAAAARPVAAGGLARMLSDAFAGRRTDAARDRLLLPRRAEMKAVPLRRPPPLSGVLRLAAT